MEEEKEEVIVNSEEILQEKTADDIIKETSEEEKKPNEIEYEENFEEILKKTSFGTELREALEKIADGKIGALIVLAEPSKLKDVVMGGFKINCKFSGERLMEISKMDGAIIVDSHLKKIHYANVLLVPDASIPSRETGTRHQAAERTAKQTGQLVIAVSQRTGNITIYTKYFRYKLRSVGNLIVRFQSVLDSLEEQKKIFNSLINYLNILEFTNLVTAVHVVSALQKAELIIRGNKLARRYILELGTDSQLLDLRLKEIMRGVNENFINIIKDYGKKSFVGVKKELDKLDQDSLLELDNISKIFGFSSLEEQLESRGHRILSKIEGINEKIINTLIKNYGNLKGIMDSNNEDMRNIFDKDNLGINIKEELDKLKNSAMLSQSI